MNCDHDFDLPLFGYPDGPDGRVVIVGYACAECGHQLFEGQSLTWTGTSNVTTYYDWSGA